MTPNPISLHFVILAGGESTCFGAPKIAAEFQEEPMIYRILAEIKASGVHTDPVYLSVKNRTQWKVILSILEEFADVDMLSDFKIKCFFAPDDWIVVEAIYDSTNENEFAPIFGLYSVFQQIIEGYVQVLPCDLPHFTHEELLKFLESFLELQDYDELLPSAFVPRWRNGEIEPLLSLYTVDAFLDEIEYQILEDMYDLEVLFDKIEDIRYVSIEDLWPDKNIRERIFSTLTDYIDQE